MNFTFETVHTLVKVKKYLMFSLNKKPSSCSLADPKQEPVWVLGIQYTTTREEVFLDVESKLWFSYRKDFAPIVPLDTSSQQHASDSSSPVTTPTSSSSQNAPTPSIWTKALSKLSGDSGTVEYTSDAGWGCMMRTGQMLMGQVFILKHLGRQWRLPSHLSKIYHKHQKKSKPKSTITPQQQPPQQTANTIYYQRPPVVRNSKSSGGLNVFTNSSNSIFQEPDMVQYYSSDSLQQQQGEEEEEEETLKGVANGSNTSELEEFSEDDKFPHIVNTNDGMALIVPSKNATLLSEEYHMILGFFMDKPECPFSIHNIAQHGNLYGKKLGEWFGPTTISLVLQKLVDTYFGFDMSVYVAEQGILYVEELIQKMKMSHPDESKNLILLIPLRLGVDKFNMMYRDFIRNVFKIKQSLGIVGGRPNSSLYFIGYQDIDILYLDPHIVQKTSNLFETYHVSYPSKMKIASMDPSMVLGFFCKDRRDLDECLEQIQQLLIQGHKYPPVGIQQRKPDNTKLREFMEEMDQDYFIKQEEQGTIKNRSIDDSFIENDGDDF